MTSIRCLYILLIVSGLLSSCAPDIETSTPRQVETHFLSPTSTSSAIKPTSTPSQVPSVTPSLLVTLEPEQAANTIRTLLQKPIDCEAPCFWGITPGSTTYNEAQNIFAQLGLDLRFTIADGGKKYYGTIYDLDDSLEIAPDITVQGNIVKNLNVGITPLEKTVDTIQKWSAYSPRTLIERYGHPSKVNFALDWGPQSFFEMDMYFDKSDLIVHYSVYGYIEKTFPQVCPLTIPFDYVSLWMGKDPLYPPGDVRLLGESTSLTLEEFSTLMVGKSTTACFTLKSEAFQ